MTLWSTKPAPPVVALIPIRSFATGKSRLSEALDHLDRRRLVISMAESVLEAVSSLPVLVASNDPEVSTWASQRNAKWFAPSAGGLNQAITEGRDLLANLGVARVVICHADIPDATDLTHLTGRGTEVILVSDRLGQGTNVLSLPTTTPFTFHYGPRSRELHVGEAARRGLAVNVVSDPAWEHDVDEPNDLQNGSNG